MRSCPTCGRQVPPHVTTCPDDGSPIGVPTRPGSTPPTNAQTAPPESTPAPPSQPQPLEWSDEPPPEQSSLRAWIGVLIASLVLLGAYSVARDRLLGPADSPDETAESAEAESSTSKKRKKKRRASKRSGTNQVEEYDEPIPTFEIDDREFGDIISEGERERAAAQAAAAQQAVEEKFIPPPEMYQPDGPYKPTASYVEPGARDNVITLDLGSKSGSSGPLDEADVKKVLRVSALMPCYDEVVQKVPQMRGRVRMRFVIAGDGHVMEATITDSQLRSRTVEACIVKRARKFRFPASGGQKTRFTTHFDFSSR